MGRLCDLLLASIALVGIIAVSDNSMAQQKAPVPDADAQATAKKTAAEIYGNRFAEAKKADEKAALAEEIIEAALKVQDGLPGQFVLLTIARDAAASAGDAVTALKAVDEVAKRFAVPTATMQGEILLAAAREASTTTQRKAVAELASGVIEKLADAAEYELAVKVCENAQTAATRSREYALARELAAKETALKRAERDSRGYREALLALDKNPIDPEANLVTGRYLCFVRGDWEWGVPRLALGSDADLKVVAAKDLRGAGSVEEQTALGDAWWDLAQTSEDAERDAMLLRAGSWYRQAEPRLAGDLVGLRIKQRLDEIGNLGREVPKLSRLATSSPPPPLATAPFEEKAARRHQAAWAKYLQVPIVHTNSIGMKFVLIPPGEFNMGSTEAEVNRLAEPARQQSAHGAPPERLHSEVPQHQVKITRPLYFGTCEVTQEQYQRLMGSNPSKFQGIPGRPVEQVSWPDAVDFCRRLSGLPEEQSAGAKYRLPTEAEWEHACRAGTATAYSFGDNAADLDRHGWWQGNAKEQTHVVGQLQPNAWGLFDMHGNVWEWCQDWLGMDYYRQFATTTAVDPQGASAGEHRVSRGGGWCHGIAHSRSAFRGSAPVMDQTHGLGFRVCCELSTW